MIPSIEHKAQVLSLGLNLITYQDALACIISIGSGRKSSYVCFANVHMTIEAHWDKEFAAQVNAATMVVADGVPLMKSLRLLHRIKQERIAGMDVMPDLLQLSTSNRLKVFFFGSTAVQLEGIRKRAIEEMPELQIVGMLSPPFNEPLDKQIYFDEINNSGAHLVFVSLGCPKQEKWMAKNSKKINACLLGVGGAFPVYSGQTTRAPKWMQKYALEWLYRLIQEPKRMWKRYFVTNSMFTLLLFKELISSGFKKESNN